MEIGFDARNLQNWVCKSFRINLVQDDIEQHLMEVLVMNKAVVLHLDKSSEPLRTKLNLLESLYTIWYLQKIKGIDIIVHSVHHGGQFF